MFRLRQLRRERNITLKAFGKMFGLAESTISLYENEKRQPDMETMQKFANFFGVTVDYLIGREEAQAKNAPAPDPEAEARERLVSLMMDYTPEEIQRIMDFAAGIKAARR